MRARAGAGSAVAVGFAVVMAACSPNPTQSPSATPFVAPSVVAGTLVPSGSPSPSLATPGPGASMGAWVVRPVPETTTAGGADLVSTVSGKTQFIHVVVSNLEEGMQGGFDASVYFRTRNAGLGWEDRLLIGGMSPRIAAAGPNVYVAFEAYGCGGGAGVLRNSDHGRHGAWAPLSCVTRNRAMGSEGAPAIAATGSLVYVASVDDANGRVGVGISRDHGRTWRRVDLGPARPDESGIRGPEVAATGAFAAVAWTDRGRTFTRTSLDSGIHWDASSTLPGGVVSASARGSRLAFGGSADDGSSAIFIWAARDGWGEIAVPAIPPTSPTEPRSASVALGPGTSVAVTHPVCQSTDVGGLEGDMWWATSPDGGVTWKPLEPLPICAGSGPIAWGTDGRAFLLLEGQEDGYALAVHP